MKNKYLIAIAVAAMIASPAFAFKKATPQAPAAAPVTSTTAAPATTTTAMAPTTTTQRAVTTTVASTTSTTENRVLNPSPDRQRPAQQAARERPVDRPAPPQRSPSSGSTGNAMQVLDDLLKKTR